MFVPRHRPETHLLSIRGGMAIVEGNTVSECVICHEDNMSKHLRILSGAADLRVP